MEKLTLARSGTFILNCSDNLSWLRNLCTGSWWGKGKPKKRENAEGMPVENVLSTLFSSPFWLSLVPISALGLLKVFLVLCVRAYNNIFMYESVNKVKLSLLFFFFHTFVVIKVKLEFYLSWMLYERFLFLFNFTINLFKDHLWESLQ